MRYRFAELEFEFDITGVPIVTDKLTEIDISSKYNIYVTYEDRFRVYLGDNTETDMKLTFAELMIKEFEPTQRGSVDAHDITMGSVIVDN